MRYAKLIGVGLIMAGLMVTVGAMAADASEEGPSPWDALWMGEGFPPAPKAPANSPKAREENADLKACGCEWAKEIKYRAPSEIPVPDSVVAEWKKLPLTDERIINAWKAAYQRREWKAYLRGLSPCARAGLSAWQSRYEESESRLALMEAIAREAGKERTPEKAEAFAERWARAARDRVLIAAGYDPVLVVRPSGRRMNLGAQGKVRDAPPNKFGGIDAKDAPANRMGRIPGDAAVPAANGGQIANGVPAEVRVRAQSAYEQAYTRSYRAYLGASPAAGDPTASPLSAAQEDCPECQDTPYWQLPCVASHCERARICRCKKERLLAERVIERRTEQPQWDPKQGPVGGADAHEHCGCSELHCKCRAPKKFCKWETFTRTPIVCAHNDDRGGGKRGFTYRYKTIEWADCGNQGTIRTRDTIMCGHGESRGQWEKLRPQESYEACECNGGCPEIASKTDGWYYYSTLAYGVALCG
jgi:hypothetical protein